MKGTSGDSSKRRAAELRIHGVGGTTETALLGEVHEHAVAGPLPGIGDANCGVWSRCKDPDTQGFVWGKLTSQSRLQPLWIVLFPFTLLNAAGWMHRRVRGQRDRKVTATRFVVHVLGLLLTATWVVWLGVIILDLFAHQAARDLGDDDLRAAAALLLLVAIVGALCLIARSTQHQFEHRHTAVAATSASRDRRRRVDPHENLNSESFFDHPTDARRLLGEHAIVIAVCVGLVGWRALDRTGDGGSLQFGGWITGIVAVQFTLLACLVLITCAPLDWRRSWRVAGPAVAATTALMLSNGFFAGVALSVRKSLDLQAVPLGSELAFLDVY